MGVTFEARLLFGSPIARVVDIRWCPGDGNPTEAFCSPRPEITFQRQGMFLKQQGRRRVACDPTTLVFFNDGETYRMAHPIREPCACTALMLEPEVLADIVGRSARWRVRRPESLFPFDQCVCDPDVAALHYRLYSAALACPGVVPLAIEELAVALARRVVESAGIYHAMRPRRGRQPGTRRAHAEIVQAARELLARRYRDRLTLAEIARQVHCAPNHLCWLFRQHAGMTIHRYLVRLRLAAAMERLAAGPVPLGRLAVELGFSHHSHLTTLFRREFSVPPSRLCRLLSVPGPPANT